MNYPLADTEPSMCLAQIQPISDTVCQVRSSSAEIYTTSARNMVLVMVKSMRFRKHAICKCRI
jgi:hypothetical protein